MLISEFKVILFKIFEILASYSGRFCHGRLPPSGRVDATGFVVHVSNLLGPINGIGNFQSIKDGSNSIAIGGIVVVHGGLHAVDESQENFHDAFAHVLFKNLRTTRQESLMIYSASPHSQIPV